MSRNRLTYAVLIAIVIGAGLTSRSEFGSQLPAFFVAYAGDTLWALMVFLGLAFVFPKASTTVVAVVAITISFSVEISQLYQPEWLNQIRATRPGALVLGAGFMMSDLLCYSAGVMIGIVGETLCSASRVKRNSISEK